MFCICDSSPRRHGAHTKAYRRSNGRRGKMKGVRILGSLSRCFTGRDSNPPVAAWSPPTGITHLDPDPRSFGSYASRSCLTFPCASLYTVPFCLSSRKAAWPVGTGNGGAGNRVRLIPSLMPDPADKTSYAVRRYRAGVMPFPKRWVTWLAQRRPTKMFAKWSGTRENTAPAAEERISRSKRTRGPWQPGSGERA